jgi:hypothetical protein
MKKNRRNKAVATGVTVINIRLIISKLAVTTHFMGIQKTL